MSLFPGVPNDPQAEFYAGLARALSAAGEGQPQVQPVPSHAPEPAPEEDPREAAIARFAETSGLDPELARKLVHVESSGNPDAVSPKGARGLFQLTPPALQDVGADESVLGDPLKEAEIAGTYARKLREQYGAKSDAELLAAYNAGPSVIGKPPEEWPEETRQYVARILGPEALGSTSEEETETPGEAAQEQVTGEEPGETPVDESGEPIAETPEGQPVTAAEVEQDPLEAAREVTPDEEEALLSPEDEEQLRQIIESAELTPTQRLGIAILAIQHPQMAMQMLSQAQAGRAQAVRAGLNLLRERMIGRRMEQKQEDMLFRQQVNEFHRRHRQLLEQMAKDGIEIPEADQLPDIPANVETPEELERANAALDQWLAAYSKVKTTENRRRQLTENVQKAIDLSRKGGSGSEMLKTLYPDWKDRPELRSTVEKLEEQERQAEEMARAEMQRLQQQGQQALAAARRAAAEADRIQQLTGIDKARAITETKSTLGRLEDEIRLYQQQVAELEFLRERAWPWQRKSYDSAIAQIRAGIDRMLQEQERLRRIEALIESGSAAGALNPDNPVPRDPETAYDIFRGHMQLRNVTSWQIPGADPGMTMKWFVENALGTGRVDWVEKYGPAVAQKALAEALKVTGGDVYLAKQLAWKWIEDVTTGAPWYARPLPGVAGEAWTEEQMANFLNQATSQAVAQPQEGQ